MTTSNFDDQALSLIEEHVRRLLVVMDFSESKVRCSLQEGTLFITIDASEIGRLLIGSQGGHLIALQHIIRCLLRPHLKESMRIIVDVNGYRARREESLLHLAQEVARKAQRTGRTIAMEPMSSADRRAVHAALANQKDVRTESLGDEPNRRVVVRPVFL